MAQDASVDEVVVTGIQQSLAAATDVKRNSAQIVDAVVAEDMGKLPDHNIAEALQRITGVSISSDFGVGESISIRGLSQNRVELNVRSTTGDSLGGISLDDFPSSFLKTVEVIKTPTADMVEGALGGTARMKTIRPLELDGLTIAGSFDYELANKTEEYAPIGNIVAGNKYELENGGIVGVIGMYSFQNRVIRQDEYHNDIRLIKPEDITGIPAGMTANTPSGSFAIRKGPTVQQFEQHRDRTAMNLTVEYAPSEKGSFYAEYTTTDLEGHEEGSSILDISGDIVFNENTTQDGGGQVSNYTLEGVQGIPKTWSEFRNTESTSLAVGGDWDYADLSPAFVVDGNITSATAGTIDLDPYRATQFDVSYEHYLGEGGMVSAALFTKDVDSFLTTTMTCEASSLTVNTNTANPGSVCQLLAGGATNPDIVTFPDNEPGAIAAVAAGTTGLRVRRTSNGEDGKVEGFELGFQKQFADLPGIWSGLGFAGNYTYADSEQPNGQALEGISENTYNAQVYWERDAYQLRLAYNYRDDYLFDTGVKRVEEVGVLATGTTSADLDPTVGNDYRDGRGQLDLSGSWKVHENVTLAASITNVLGAPFRQLSELGSPWRYTEADRRIAFGIRAKY